MNLEAIRDYNVAHQRMDKDARNAALVQLGNPSKEVLVEMGVRGMDDPDRNVRFQMVRLIGAQWCEETPKALLLGLADPARRVRKLATKLSAAYAGNAEIEARLSEIASDETEIRKVREAAFHSLSSGKFLASLATSPEEARKFFEDVPSLAPYRAQALQILVSLDPLPEGAPDILRYVVETGTKEEAVDATRALCGFRVVHIGAYPNQREARKIAQTMEPARGRVFFWVPRRDPEAG